ncbi:MAG: hypothetical protein LBQ44_03970 [Treponema sp.]|jgi:hypothetical protein|nr:hypothetical protein [Treponema sp.]
MITMTDRKMCRTALLFLLLFLCGGAVFSHPDQKIIYPGDWPYDALTALSLEQGVLFLSGTPLTVRRFRSMLGEIDEEKLSPGGKQTFEKLREYLDSREFMSFGTGSLRFEVGALIQPELYLRTNRDLDFMYGNYRRRSFFEVPVSLSFSPYITMEMDTGVDQTRDAVYRENNYMNFPYGETYNFTLPHRAYLSLGLPLPKSSGLEFRIGIGEDFIGRTRLGSVILSDYMKDLNYSMLSLYSPVLSYSARVMQLGVNRYLYLHHLEGRFFKRVSFTFVEGVLVNAPLELRFLNPLMVFHSFGAWNDYDDYNRENDEPDYDNDESRVGSFYGMRVEFQLFRYGRIYGIWALNELQTPGERSSDPSARRPDSFAFQGGGEFSLPLAAGRLFFGLEGLYTYPFFYVSRNERWSFYKPRGGNTGGIEYWTGTPVGPDSAAAALWAGWEAGRLSLSCSLTFLAQGVRSGAFGKGRITVFDNYVYHPARQGGTYQDTLLTSPTGTAAYTWQIGLSGTWELKKWLILSAHPGYQIIDNFAFVQGERRHGFEIALSARFLPAELKRLQADWN